jgi:hypothetical protein
LTIILARGSLQGEGGQWVSDAVGEWGARVGGRGYKFMQLGRNEAGIIERCRGKMEVAGRGRGQGL